MPSTIKLFRTLKKFYKKTVSFNVINVFLFYSYVIIYIATTAFFFLEAQTADENGTSFYASITLLAIAINISISAWKMSKILALIEKYEEFIAKSSV